MLNLLAVCVGASRGALTTFSTFSAEVVAMPRQARYAVALGTATPRLLGSLLLTSAGIWSAGLLLRS